MEGKFTKKIFFIIFYRGQSETEKVYDLLRNIPINNIAELNVLIYAGAKLVFEKSGCL